MTKNDECSPEEGTAIGTRQNAVRVLREKAKHLRRQADGMEALASRVDGILTNDEDEALWLLTAR